MQNFLDILYKIFGGHLTSFLLFHTTLKRKCQLDYALSVLQANENSVSSIISGKFPIVKLLSILTNRAQINVVCFITCLKRLLLSTH